MTAPNVRALHQQLLNRPQAALRRRSDPMPGAYDAQPSTDVSVPTRSVTVLHLAPALSAQPTVYLFDAQDDRWTDVPIRTFIQKCPDNGRYYAHPDAAPRARRVALHRNKVLTKRLG